MEINLRGVPAAGGATFNVRLGLEAAGIRRDASSVRVDVRVFDADDPEGPAQIFPMSLPASWGGRSNEEIEAQAIRSVALDIEIQTDSWKSAGRRPEAAHVQPV